MKPPTIRTETGKVAASMLAGWGLDWADTIAAIEDEARLLPGPDFEVTEQETIQETTGDYLELLERMVEQGRKRNDPTLAVALNIEVLDRFVSEVRASRIRLRMLKAEFGRPSA